MDRVIRGTQEQQQLQRHSIKLVFLLTWWLGNGHFATCNISSLLTKCKSEQPLVQPVGPGCRWVQLPLHFGFDLRFDKTKQKNLLKHCNLQICFGNLSPTLKGFKGAFKKNGMTAILKARNKAAFFFHLQLTSNQWQQNNSTKTPIDVYKIIWRFYPVWKYCWLLLMRHSARHTTPPSTGSLSSSGAAH